MAEVLIKSTTAKFSGGIALNSKSGLPNSARFLRNMDIFSDDDSVSLNPRPLRDDGGVVTDLVTDWADCRPFTTTRFFYGNTGNIYANNNGVWTLDRAVNTHGAAGQGMGMLADTLFYATGDSLGQKQYLTQGGQYNDDFVSDGINNIDVVQSAIGFTYNIPMVLSEAPADTISFTGATALTRDPLKAFLLTLSNKGSGTITITIHDRNNVVVATTSLNQTSLLNGKNTFLFPTPARIIIGNPYHAHVTCTTSDAQVQTSVNQNINTADYSTMFGILISTAKYHPIAQHINGVTGIIAIANERYIATYDMNTFLPNKITLEPGFEIRAFMKYKEFLVALSWKGGSIDNSEYGRAYYWDGVSPYFNYFDEITNGMPNAGMNYKSRIFTILGSSGSINIGTEPTKLIQPAPKLTKGKRVEVEPRAMAVWQNRIHFGYGNTNDTNGTAANNFTGFEPGVYEFGNQSDRAVSYQSVSTEVLNFGYQPSIAISDPTQFRIGMIAPFGKDLYFSWKSGTAFGVDRVAKGNGPAATGSYESLIYDQGLDANGQLVSMPQHTKTALNLVITCAPLPVGCTLTPKYRKNRATAWTYGTAVGAGISIAQLNFATIGAERYREMEVGFDVTAGSLYPTIIALYYEYDPNIREVGIS